MKSKPTTLLSQNQLAPKIGLSEPTLRKLVKAGRIEADFIGHNRLFFLPSRINSIRQQIKVIQGEIIC